MMSDDQHSLALQGRNAIDWSPRGGTGQSQRSQAHSSAWVLPTSAAATVHRSDEPAVSR